MSETVAVDSSLASQNLRRLLFPRTIAVVGANESLGMSNNAVLPMLEAGATVHLVNPKRDSLYGQAVFPSLTSVGQPVDAVLGLVNANRSVDLIAEAAELGCGGVVVTAGGFGEAGDEGQGLQTRLEKTARDAGIAVIGPNCAGFKNVPLGANLFTGGRLDLTPGPIAVVSQSGFLVRSALAAARDRQLGVSIAVSSGNEAVCDLADYVNALTADEGTSVICLVIETVRRPEAFFDAVAKARAAGKAVLALKLGRSNRARRIMASHTGAIADESWVYDLAFAEHGVVAVRDIDHLLDAAQLLAQLPSDYLEPSAEPKLISSIGIITTSGGVAALATDIADEVDAPVPPLEDLEPWVRERVPGDTVNPLDLTGFVMTKRELTEELFEKYAEAVDLLMLAWWIGDGDAGWSSVLLEPFASVAERLDTPLLVSPVESTSVGPWVDSWRERGLLFGRGIESVYRSVAALNRHLSPSRVQQALRTQPTASGANGSNPVSASSIDPSSAMVDSEIGPIVSFKCAMEMLTESGIDVAPYVMIEAGDAVGIDALEPLGLALVVKLADVPHRTELKAVSVGVTPSDVADEVVRLRAIAANHSVPATIVVQAMVSGHGEAFGGLQCQTGLGPVMLLGMGGVLVESAGRIRGRFLPVDEAAATKLVDEVAGPAVFAELRGQEPWNTDHLAELVNNLNRLWQLHGDALDSVDLNPLIVTEQGLVAVDALFTGTSI